MAKKPTPPRPEGKSPNTGLYWPCPLGLMTQSHRDLGKPAAVSVRQGQKVVHEKCPICQTRIFFGPELTANVGLSRKEAERQGYICLQSL